MLVFKERGKPEYLEKNLLEQRREPTTNWKVFLTPFACPKLNINHSSEKLKVIYIKHLLFYPNYQFKTSVL